MGLANQRKPTGLRKRWDSSLVLRGEEPGSLLYQKKVQDSPCMAPGLLDPYTVLPLGQEIRALQPNHSGVQILQAKIREWVAIPFSRGSSQPRD